MANEFTMRHVASLRNANNNYQTPPNKSGYQFNQENEGGPIVGEITIATTGTDIDLSELGVPGYWEGWNLDPTNAVELCIHDGSVAHPFAELPPGGGLQRGLFPRTLGDERGVPGTGTTTKVNSLMGIAYNSSCKIVLFIFER